MPWRYFETTNTSDKASFVLESELWEEHFESLLAVVKEYIIEIWEGLGYMAIMCVLTNPVLSHQLRILGIWRGGMVSDCVREVSLAQLS